jgi:hypothetical protein
LVRFPARRRGQPDVSVLTMTVYGSTLLLIGDSQRRDETYGLELASAQL